MNPFVRRSHLLVSISDRDSVESSWTHNADAVILDLTGVSATASTESFSSCTPFGDTTTIDRGFWPSRAISAILSANQQA